MQTQHSDLTTPRREVFDYQDSYLIENLERELEKFSHLLEKSPDRGLYCPEVDNADRVAEEIQRFEVENLREQNTKLQSENEKYYAKIQNIMSKIPKTLENHLIVHRLEKENMQLRALVDQAQKENLQLQNELMRLQELHENQESSTAEECGDNQVIARFEAMMLNYASNSFTTKQDDKIKELQSKLLKKNEEFAMLRKSFETEIADYQEKIRGLTEEVQRLKAESERNASTGLISKKSLRKIREINQNLLQIAVEEDAKKSRAKKSKRSTVKYTESDEENVFEDSNVMCDEDDEFAPEEMSEEDDDGEERKTYPKKRKANVKKKANNNEVKKMKKNEFKEALSQARNTIAYHLFN